MKNKNINKNRGLPGEFEDFLKNANIPYSKSKQDVWEELSSKLDKSENKTSTLILANRYTYLVAAIITVLLITGLTARFYTKLYTSKAGEHTSSTLPDGSKVMLNAESTLKFYPVWWKIKREVTLSGEAFFEIEKGEKFSVKSKNGITTVMGTSFNIYARGNEYEVTCVTGKVKVESTDRKVAKTILPNEKAIIQSSGSILVKTNYDTRKSISWKENMIYTSGSLENVIKEIERQYNVRIKISAELKNKDVQAGNFPKPENVESALNIVLSVLQLTYEETGRNEYTIKKKQP